MKKYCINLAHRKDRRDHFDQANNFAVDVNSKDFEFFDAYNGYKMTYKDLHKLGFMPDHNWIDPTFNRRLTKGEIGCLASHVSLWRLCVALKEPLLVLEDDCVFKPNYEESAVENLLKRHNIVYLGYNEMTEVKEDLGHYVVPGFAYQTHAYAINPEGARILLDALPVLKGIPADEFISSCFNELKPVAFKNPVATQLSREESATDVECHGDDDLFPFEKLKVFTVATDEMQAHALINSCNRYNIDLNILGKNSSAFDMTGLGGGVKINLLREALEACDDDDLILFLDGYDTFFARELSEIHQRFLAMATDIVFSAERACWPDAHLAGEFEAETSFKYLNSGTFIGQCKAIKQILETPISNSDDDQRYYTMKYLQNKEKTFHQKNQLL